jgi:methylated-DNA-[protein]-cysteine S-methyltransferase
MYYKAYIDCPIGWVEMVSDENHIKKISLLNFIEHQNETITPPQYPSVLVACWQQMNAYLSESKQDFDLSALSLAPEGTEFQQRVWRELLKIPFGTTISYLELARRLGDEKVIRAAAAANGKNPIAIIIPCHRVIGSDGNLTGYAGGLNRKKWLLLHEKPLQAQQGELF